MRKALIILAGLGLFMGCGESEADKVSRESLSSVVRKFNVTWDSVHGEQSKEEELSRLSYKEFYLKQRERVLLLRSELAGATLTPKFANYRLLIDSLFTDCVSWIDNRESVLRSCFNGSGSAQSFYSTYAAYEDESTRQKAGNELTLSQAELTRVLERFEEIDELIGTRIGAVNRSLISNTFVDSLVTATRDSTDSIVRIAKEIIATPGYKPPPPPPPLKMESTNYTGATTTFLKSFNTKKDTTTLQFWFYNNGSRGISKARIKCRITQSEANSTIIESTEEFSLNCVMASDSWENIYFDIPGIIKFKEIPETEVEKVWFSK